MGGFDALGEIRAGKSLRGGSEQDRMAACSELLAALLRGRPTLPASRGDATKSFDDVPLAVRLPLFSCPFRECRFATDGRAEFLTHLVSGCHAAAVEITCGEFLGRVRALDFVHNAISVRERKQIPRIGMATTRRALRALATTYNDESIQALACFICGCIYTTFEGPKPPPDEDGVQRVSGHCDITMASSSWLRGLERHHPGSLLNNCSYEL